MASDALEPLGGFLLPRLRGRLVWLTQRTAKR